MKRAAIFTSACCTGWAWAYEADDATQAMIRKHADWYNEQPQWSARNCDGTVYIYDNADEAVQQHNKDQDEASYPEYKVENLDGLLAWYAEDGDGRTVDAAWIVHMLLTDPTQEGWLPA